MDGLSVISLLILTAVVIACFGWAVERRKSPLKNPHDALIAGIERRHLQRERQQARLDRMERRAENPNYVTPTVCIAWALSILACERLFSHSGTMFWSGMTIAILGVVGLTPWGLKRL